MHELTSIRVYITNYRCICPKLLMLYFSSNFFLCKFPIAFRILCKVWMEMACILGTVAVRSPKSIRLRGISRVQFWVCFWYKTWLAWRGDIRCGNMGQGRDAGLLQLPGSWSLFRDMHSLLKILTSPVACSSLTGPSPDAELHEECEVLSDKVD